MTARVLGLDLSLSSTGAATVTDDRRIDTWVFTTEPLGDKPDVVDVDARLSKIARWACGLVTTNTVLAVLEGPAHAAKFGQPHERAGLWWRTARGLVQREIPIAVVPPGTLKVWLAGHGRASKDDMRRAAHACWPGHGLHNPRVTTDDEVDALGLAAMGSAWMGWDGPWLDGRRTAGLKAAQWPDRPEAAREPLPAPTSSPFAVPR